MSSERQLTDEAMVCELWAGATIEMLTEGWDMQDQADFYGRGLADAVVRGEMSVKDLRGFAHKMNALDKETAEKSGNDIESLVDADYFEALARRIGNHATAQALSVVGARDTRGRYLRENGGRLGISPLRGQYASMPGLGIPEDKDRWPL